MSAHTQLPEVTAHDAFTFEDVRILAGATGPCITIVMDIANPLTLATKIKVALKSVEKQLAAHGAAPDLREALLKPLRELTGTAELAGVWSNSLVLLRSPDMFRYFFLHRRVLETEHVGEHFQVYPLLASLTREQRFCVLGLNRRNIRLLRCTQHRAEQIETHDLLPRDILSWLNTRQPDHNLNNRSTAGPSIGAMKGVSFTTGSDREREAEYLAHFYKAVDGGANTLLHGEPLLLAGTDPEVALFRRLTSYPRILQQHVHGSTSNSSDAELHRLALDVVMRSPSEALQRALADFQSRTDGQLVSFNANEAVKAAFEGRLTDLLLAEGTELAGKWNEETHEVETIASTEELLNAAALETVLHGGQAFVLPPEEMPAGQNVVAVLRY
jgi:hypothetical protein